MARLPQYFPCSGRPTLARLGASLVFAWASNKLIVIETVAFGKGAWTGALAAQCALASLSVSSYVTLKKYLFLPSWGGPFSNQYRLPEFATALLLLIRFCLAYPILQPCRTTYVARSCISIPTDPTLHNFLRQRRSSTFRKGPNEFRYKFSF